MRKDNSSDFEWTATVINLNHPKIDPNLLACKVLAEYITFVRKVQMYKYSANLTEAINSAVDECISENILKDILLRHKAEVIELVLTTFNKELHEKYLKEDAREEGYAEGKVEGKAEGRAEGRAEGLIIGLRAAVLSMSSLTGDIELIHQAIIKNVAYKDVTKEQVENILNT